MSCKYIFRCQSMCNIPSAIILLAASIEQFLFFFFLRHVHTRVGGGGIRTCDLRFIRRGSQPIELPLGDQTISFYRHNLFYIQIVKY
jgi:hypothetical protein